MQNQGFIWAEKFEGETERKVTDAPASGLRGWMHEKFVFVNFLGGNTPAWLYADKPLKPHGILTSPQQTRYKAPWLRNCFIPSSKKVGAESQAASSVTVQ